MLSRVLARTDGWLCNFLLPFGARLPTDAPALSASLVRRRQVVQAGSGESIVRLADIDYISAARNYLVVHVGDKKFLLRDTISKLENRLSGEAFLRTHRSFIVNVYRIQEIRPADSGHRIRLKNGPEIPLSRSYREAVKASLAS